VKRPRLLLLAIIAIPCLLLFIPARADDNWKWSPHSKPFDLVWDVNNEDYNGHPWNPIWAWQLDHTGVPDFASICGPAITSSTGPIDENLLRQRCTSQHTHLDVDQSDFKWTGYCSGLLDGHLTWTIATQTGLFYWEDFSGNGFDDGDYNLGFWDVPIFPSLVPPANPAAKCEEFYCGLTSNETSLGLEFNDYETVDNFADPWWQQVKNQAENGNTPSDRSARDFMNRTKSLAGVVVGLVGIDGVHGGYAESHPVFALALRTSGGDLVDGKLTENWVFFLTNFGSGGGCSSTEWHWRAKKDTYYIQLPGYKDATKMEIKGLNNVGFPAVWGWGPGGAISIPRSADKKWTLIKVVNSGDAFGIDGEFTLTYTIPKNSAGHPKKDATIPPRKKESEDSLLGIAEKIADAKVRSKFTAEMQAALKSFTNPRAGVTRTPLKVDTTANDEPRTPGAASRGELTVPEATADTAKKQRNDALKKVVSAYKMQIAIEKK
jgi:hypothetical protein